MSAASCANRSTRSRCSSGLTGFVRWASNPAAFDALLQKLADDEVRAGKRQIPGFDVTEERVL